MKTKNRNIYGIGCIEDIILKKSLCIAQIRTGMNFEVADTAVFSSINSKCGAGMHLESYFDNMLS